MATRRTWKPLRTHWAGTFDYAQLVKLYGMAMVRFTRLTDGFSKKIQNHMHAIALNFRHYNFCRIHQTLRVTPAMAAGLTTKLFEIEDLAALID